MNNLIEAGLRKNEILLLKLVQLGVQEYQLDASVPDPDDFHYGIETACDEIMDMLEAMIAERVGNNE